MSSHFKLALFLNAVFIAVFCFWNYAQWDITHFNHSFDIRTQWHPDSIRIETLSGNIGTIIPNWTFIVFWLSTTVNLYFIFKLQKSKGKETKPTT